MSQERIIWAEGIDRSSDPRHIGKNSQYDVRDMEILTREALSKREGFGRWRSSDNTFSDTVRGVALMYDSDENRYLFVFYDSVWGGTDLWIEKAGGAPLIIINFFPSNGARVRSAVFGDRIYFVNGVDRPRWYKELDGSSHVWGIAGVPSPARPPADESTFDFFISRALYADCMTSSEGLGIDPPGIWRYKQTIGYYGKTDDEQIEESNAGGASEMFHCQFNTAEALGTQLEGYIKKGISIEIADFDDLILDANEAGGQDYEDEIRWMRMYRQWKMFSDELYSPFEFLVEMKKGWPISIRDVYQRDSAVVAPTTRVQIPVAHHIENTNNRLFLGRIEKEIFQQPSLPENFRGFEVGYKPDFSYRMPITITNTNSKTLTSAVIPLRFQDHTSADSTATPPSGGGGWVGAYIDTSLDLNTLAAFAQMIFVDNDGVTPLGFTRIAVNSSGTDDVTFLVEIPEIAAGGSRTIYLYFEDSELTWDPTNYAGEVGDWESIAHYPLLSSDHLMLIDFENWETGMEITKVTQKRSLAYIEQGPTEFGTGVAKISKAVNSYFFNDTSFNLGVAPTLNVNGSGSPPDIDCAQIKFYPLSDSTSVLSFVFRVSFGQTSGHGGTVRLCDPAYPEDEISILVTFADGVDDTLDVTATAYSSIGSSSTNAINISLGAGAEQYLIAVVVANGELILYVIKGDLAGHPGAGASWSTSGWQKSSDAVAFTDPLRMYSAAEAFIAVGGNVNEAVHGAVRFKDIHVLTREIDGFDELIAMWNRDAYWPYYGLAVVEDRESSASADKYPDRFYFSKLNQPNSVEATDFRDMGELGRPIQGIKGIHNRVFVFDENKIRALFSAGSEQALALTSGDTKMWNLSHDLTGDVGGLGVLAPDSLVTMEFAGRDGVGFLSRRGFYFFDGNGFAHISEKVDNLIYDEDVDDDYRRNLTAHFLGRKRQLILSVLGWDTPADYEYWSLVANMKFAHDAKNMVWARSSNLVKYGVELDFGIDTGEFVYVNSPSTAHPTKQILALEKNSDPDIYKDISQDQLSGIAVAALAMSKQFDVFDAELLKGDLHTSGDAGYEVDLTVFKDSLTSGAPTISNITSGMYRFPIGTHATRFLFQLYDNTAFRCVFERLDFYFNVHGERRL